MNALKARADSLDRFHAAHARKGDYSRALHEIQAGRKRTHWMWFVFPQLRALGKSEIARFYGIADRAEAVAYLDDPILRMRLFECTTGILSHPRLILSHPDNYKLRSCMTLFREVADDPALPNSVLEKFYGGRPDQLTLDVLDGKAITLPAPTVQPWQADLRGTSRVPNVQEELEPWSQARIYAFARSFGLTPAETHRMVRAWIADRDRSYDAGWNDHADEEAS